MIGATGFVIVLRILVSASIPAAEQQLRVPPKSASAPKISSVMDTQLSILEGQFVPAAEAMPEDKYPFAPTTGEFKGVRNPLTKLK